MSSRQRARRNVAVLGAGLMGQGIIEVLARAGHSVKFFDPNVAAPQPSSDTVHACSTVAEAVSGAELIFEAIVEDLAAKQALYKEVEESSPGAPIASNTSTFVPSRLAEGLKSPSRLLVAHFFNPAAIVPLVEVVPGPRTASTTVESFRSLLEGAGKTVVLLRRESVGFVANRLQAALCREAMHLVQAGIATTETVDSVLNDCLAPRWMVAGPFLTMDRGGLDVWQGVCSQIFPTLDESPHAPLLEDLVSGGELGAKTGSGFFRHSLSQRKRLDAAISQAFEARQRLRDA